MPRGISQKLAERAGAQAKNQYRPTADVRLEWGHPILTPDGREIRVPNIFQYLKALGLVVRHQELGLYQLRVAVYAMLADPGYVPLLGPLRRLLGVDVSGPVWTQCYCRRCQRREEVRDRTRAPWGMRR